MNERDQVISFLLQSCDNYKKQLEELQKLNTELQKKLNDLQPKDVN